MLRNGLRLGRISAKKSLGTRFFHRSVPALTYKTRVEEDIRYLIDSLPPASRLYQNEDGTPRQPSELELHKIAQLSLLASTRKIPFWKWFFLKEKEAQLYAQNYADLEQLVPSLENGAASDIIDKIPYEDKDGSVKWKVVRADSDEGWEKLSYYGLVPGLLLLIGIHLFKDQDGVQEWAEKELDLRALEDSLSSEEATAQLNNVGKTPEEIRARDNLIIERIISGEYDKLSQLQLKKRPEILETPENA